MPPSAHNSAGNPVHPLHGLGFTPLAAAPPVAATPRCSEVQHVVKGSISKGSRVRLADGTVARVQYVDTQMRIARVRTVDGRNITVRQKQLRPLPAEHAGVAG